MDYLRDELHNLRGKIGTIDSISNRVGVLENRQDTLEAMVIEMDQRQDRQDEETGGMRAELRDIRKHIQWKFCRQTSVIVAAAITFCLFIIVFYNIVVF